MEITQLTKSGNEARRGYNLTLAALEKSLKDAQVSPAASANLRDRIEQLDGQVKYYKREVDITGANREQALQKLKLINQERNRIKADYSNEIKKLTQEIDFIRKQARLLD